MSKNRILLVAFLLLMAVLLMGSGSRVGIYRVAVFPIELSCFLDRQNFYLAAFPTRLRDYTDNSAFEAFKTLGGFQQIHTLPPHKSNRSQIYDFHDKLERQGTDFPREFCTSHNPMINVLITYRLAMPCNDMTEEGADVDILAYYITKESSSEFTVWHRTISLTLSPKNRQDMVQKIHNAVVRLIAQYRQNPQPD